LPVKFIQNTNRSLHYEEYSSLGTEYGIGDMGYGMVWYGLFRRDRNRG